LLLIVPMTFPDLYRPRIPNEQLSRFTIDRLITLLTKFNHRMGHSGACPSHAPPSTRAAARASLPALAKKDNLRRSIAPENWESFGKVAGCPRLSDFP